ncbi:class I SAM-dependent methyltransferase [candidate division KSB1 bacterium]|nr:class I SAM-dependent methyltransferase [candidate division KSB1 bacterium]
MESSDNIHDTGERILPTKNGELSVVYSRHRFAYDYVSQFIEKKSVLDIGCGAGYGSKLLSEKAMEVVGIDQSAEAISYCKRNYQAANLSYQQADATTLSLNRQFDAAVTFQAIEHFEDVSAFIDIVKKHVVPGGQIFITTPNILPTQKSRNKNDYHCSEMTYQEFHDQLSQKFSEFKIVGITFANKNLLRTILGKTPLYKLGKQLKRGSNLKRVAGTMMDLTSFKIINNHIEHEAADLLAICKNL